MSRPRRPVPLVPRVRVRGAAFGESRSARRGRGTEIASTRPYEPGDPMSSIDWFASARLSAAHGGDEFVVRELYADDSPRVIVVADRGASMSLYAEPFPWLAKRAAARSVAEVVAASVRKARAQLGLVDRRGGRMRFLRPGTTTPEAVARRFAAGGWDGTRGDVAAGLELLLRDGHLGAGSFVFVLSDFLDTHPAPWSALRSRGFELVPVILQDPVWERSFPDLAGVTLRVSRPDGAEAAAVRFSRSTAREQRERNEQRFSALLARFRALGADPVVVGAADDAEVDRAFARWAARRSRLLRAA